MSGTSGSAPMTRTWTRAVLLVLPLLSQQTTSRAVAAPDLVGVWKLAVFEDQDERGRTVGISGDPPAGFLVYTQSRHFFVQISGFYLEPTSRAGQDRVPIPGIAYFGTYGVVATGDTVVHHVLGDVSGQYTGTDQLRPLSLRGDTLTLSDGRTWRRVFVRVRP